MHHGLAGDAAGGTMPVARSVQWIGVEEGSRRGHSYAAMFPRDESARPGRGVDELRELTGNGWKSHKTV
jgi:hypothetical protein